MRYELVILDVVVLAVALEVDLTIVGHRAAVGLVVGRRCRAVDFVGLVERFRAHGRSSHGRVGEAVRRRVVLVVLRGRGHVDAKRGTVAAHFPGMEGRSLEIEDPS